MKKKALKYLTVLAFALPLSAFDCTESYDATDPNDYTIGEDGLPHYSWLTTIPQAQFQQQVKGKGWRLFTSYTIMGNNNSKSASTEAGEGDEMFCPHDLYFSDTDIFVFEYRETENRLVSKPYQYVVADNRIVNNIIPYLQLTEAYDHRIETLEYAGTDVDGNPVYTYNTYLEMSMYELNSRWLGFHNTEEEEE